MCVDLHNFWYATLQVNANHTGKFTTSHIMYIAYLMTSCWRQWNHAVQGQRYSLKFWVKKKRYSSRKFIREFSNKNWNRRGLDHLIKKNLIRLRESPEVADYELHVTTTTSTLSLIWYRPQTHRSVGLLYIPYGPTHARGRTGVFTIGPLGPCPPLGPRPKM